jgi:hypothetical protein
VCSVPLEEGISVETEGRELEERWMENVWQGDQTPLEVAMCSKFSRTSVIGTPVASKTSVADISSSRNRVLTYDVVGLGTGSVGSSDGELLCLTPVPEDS